MQTFNYSIIAKFVYRFVNIPITFLLSLYLLLAIFSPEKTWFNAISIVVHLLLIFFINKFYFRNYKQFPYKISADNEKMICTDFFLSRKEIEIRMEDIDDIKGGIFSNTPARPVYIHDGKNNVTIGVSAHLKGYNKLMTIILSNVKQNLYNEVLDRMKEMSVVNKKGTAKKKK